MPINVSVARDGHQSDTLSHSGELGPLQPPFAQVVAQVSSASLDLTRDQLEEERRQLTSRIDEITGNLESSTKLLTGLNEKRTAAASRLKEIEAKPGQFSRHEILKAYQEAGKADVDQTQMRELCDHLKTHLDFAKRMHRALDMALRVTADAAFLRERDEDHRAESGLVAQVRAAPTTANLIDEETLLAAREYERHVLARSIDERVRFVLSDAVLQAEFCEAAIRTDPIHAGNVTRELKNRLNDALRATDGLIFELEPVILNDLGLAATLQRYAQDVTAARGIQVTTRVSGVERRAPISAERTAFRAAREAIANALRHAQPSHIQVALHLTPAALFLTVMDDGAGFAVDPVMRRVRRGYHSGLGQLCIEADLIGAEMGLESAPGQGTWFHFIVEEGKGAGG